MIAIKIKTKIPNRKAKHIAMGEIDYRDDRGKQIIMRYLELIKMRMRPR